MNEIVARLPKAEMSGSDPAIFTVLSLSVMSPERTGNALAMGGRPTTGGNRYIVLVDLVKFAVLAQVLNVWKHLRGTSALRAAVHGAVPNVRLQ